MRRIIYSLMFIGVLVSCENKNDKMLNEYEGFINKYESFYKKAKQGDVVSAISGYGELLDSTERLGKSLEEARDNGELTKEQRDRLTKLNSKFLEISVSGMMDLGKTSNSIFDASDSELSIDEDLSDFELSDENLYD